MHTWKNWLRCFKLNGCSLFWQPPELGLVQTPYWDDQSPVSDCIELQKMTGLGPICPPCPLLVFKSCIANVMCQNLAPPEMQLFYFVLLQFKQNIFNLHSQKCTSLTLCAAGKTVQTWMKYSQTANSEAQFILSSLLGWPCLSVPLTRCFVKSRHRISYKRLTLQYNKAKFQV